MLAQYIQEMDFSTIDLDLLRTFTELHPSKDDLNSATGCDCFLDPPGYPSRFVRGQKFITDPNGQHWRVPGCPNDRTKLHELWKPLSLTHPRTLEWITDAYQYFRNCYSPDGTTRRADRAVFSKKSDVQSEQVADHHVAVLLIRSFYPDYEPNLDLIVNPGNSNVPTWWQTLAEKPTPEFCLGSSLGDHPDCKTYCQACGWNWR